MSKSLILTTFRLITPQDLARLTETLKSTKKKTQSSDAELLVWDSEEHDDSKVLEFPKRNPGDEKPMTLSQIGVLSAGEQKAKQQAAQEEAEKDRPSESDFLLEEREKYKESEVKLFKANGFACYQRSSDLGIYRVTVTDEKGKEKSRLTSTQGVLVNKKQA